MSDEKGKEYLEAIPDYSIESERLSDVGEPPEIYPEKSISLDIEAVLKAISEKHPIADEIAIDENTKLIRMASDDYRLYHDGKSCLLKDATGDQLQMVQDYLVGTVRKGKSDLKGKDYLDALPD